MGKSKKKIDVFSIVIFSVLALSIVMAVVGICIAWTATTVKVADLLGGASKTTTLKLSEIAEANSKLVDAGSDPMEGYGVMSAFAYITLSLSVVTTLVFVISKFAKVKVLKWVLIAVAALTVVSAIVAIATTYSFRGGRVATCNFRYSGRRGRRCRRVEKIIITHLKGLSFRQSFFYCKKFCVNA